MAKRSRLAAADNDDDEGDEEDVIPQDDLNIEIEKNYIVANTPLPDAIIKVNLEPVLVKEDDGMTT
jgi:hypothetical protein